MCKTILFPVDFSQESLNIAKKIIEDHPGEKLDLVLVHGIHASDSIVDLLYFSKKALLAKLSSPEFDEACRLLQHLYDKQIHSLQVELFSGFTQAAFNSFVTGHKVDLLYCPAAPKQVPKNKISMDISRFLLKTNVVEKIIMPGPAYDLSNGTGVVPQISIVK